MPGARALGVGLWKIGDQELIDGAAVNGSANAVSLLAGFARRLQSGVSSFPSPRKQQAVAAAPYFARQEQGLVGRSKGQPSAC